MIESNDCKNLTFDAVSIRRSNVFDHSRLSGKNISSLFHLLIQNKHITLLLSRPYIRSNGDLLSTKIEQSSVLIHNANQIYKASMIGRY